MSYKAMLLGIMLVFAAPAPSQAAPVFLQFTATVSGTDLCLSSQGPRKFKATVTIIIVVDNGLSEVQIDGLQSGEPVSVQLIAADATSNQSNTGGNFTFFSPVAGIMDGTFKGDISNMSSFTATIVAKFSDDCTKIATIKAKRS